MKYVKLTFLYFKNRHFRKIMLLCLLPAVALAFLKSFSKTATYILHFEGVQGKFSEIFRLSTRFGWQSMLRGAAGVLLISLISAYVIGTIIRHMRTGRFDLTRFTTCVNDNFLAVFRLAVVTAIFLILFGLLNSLFIFLWSKVVRRTAWLVVVLSVISMLLLFMVLNALFAALTLWVPAMTITGQPAFPSLATSIRETKAHGFRCFYFGVLLPLIPGFIVEYLLSLTGINVLLFFGDVILYYIILLYYPVFSLSAYFDILDLDREDLLEKNRW